MITLTTDFGTSDGYVAAMKGVMCSVAPEARFVDVTHEVSPQDVMEAAFVLKSALPYFPDGTVHLVVVDPGVGTERRAVAVQHDGQRFVGPDNGLFPLLLDADMPEAAVELDDRSAWRSDDPSTTFHGRDIFAPVAAHLARGASLEEVGTPIDSLKPLRWALPITDRHTVQGWVVHVDHFGNCITNIRRSTLAEALTPDNPAPPSFSGSDQSAPDLDLDDLPPLKGYAGSAVVENLHDTYGDVAQGEPLMLFGSIGFLEISVNAGNAAELLDISKGDTVKLVFQRSDGEDAAAHPDDP